MKKSFFTKKSTFNVCKVLSDNYLQHSIHSIKSCKVIFTNNLHKSMMFYNNLNLIFNNKKLLNIFIECRSINVLNKFDYYSKNTIVEINSQLQECQFSVSYYLSTTYKCKVYFTNLVKMP